MPPNDVFDDLDEQGEQLLGSLNLGPAEEEPVRRGAASRANSVRFDESALHGSSWGGQSNRHSGDFGPIRPGSSLMMERSLSHKSDGRHSSAGHSVHSHHSVASGRASSLGMDTNYPGDDDESPSFEPPQPPVSLYVLGTVPSIVRCWLTTNFAHGTLLYADICTGSQRSVIDVSLLRELNLMGGVEREVNGTSRVRLAVYLAEAVVIRHEGRHARSRNAVPSMTVTFEISGLDPPSSSIDRKGIRIFIGSDSLRAHSADVLLSQNTMVLYGNEQDKLRVPFVRPEEESMFRHICTTNVVPEKPKLNANATPFVAGDSQAGDKVSAGEKVDMSEQPEMLRPMSPPDDEAVSDKAEDAHVLSDHNGELDGPMRDANDSELSAKDSLSVSDGSRRESSASTGIWGSWRQGAGAGPDGAQREAGNLSGYQPAGRSGRSMKVLKPSRSGSNSARTGASYEPPLPSKHAGDTGRKGQRSPFNGDNVSSSSGMGVTNRWDARRSISSGAEVKAQSTSRETAKGAGLPRSANPVGEASAFSWMTPPPPPPIKPPKSATSTTTTTSTSTGEVL